MVRHTWGPSPRARGRHEPPRLRQALKRSIPAGAGETQRVAHFPQLVGVHPRGRGGDRGGFVHHGCSPGPSPRARGRLSVPRYPGNADGSIPAVAGETTRAPAPVVLRRVHPRGRGGDSAMNDTAMARAGPSPRARGRRPHTGSDGFIAGSIPAGAGETTATLTK